MDNMLTIKMILPLQWSKRWRRVSNGGGGSAEKMSRCRLFKIRHSVIRGYADRYYPEYLHPSDDCWTIIRPGHLFREEHTAAAACEQFARRDYCRLAVNRPISVTDDNHGCKKN